MTNIRADEAPLKSEQHLVRAAPLKGLSHQLLITWAISEHAVDRYIDRVCPRVSRATARQRLAAMLYGSHYVKTLPSGLEYWRGPKPWRLRFRVDPGPPRRVATVLFAFDRSDR